MRQGVFKVGSWLGWLVLGMALAQGALAQGRSGTYTCIDSQGRRLLSDRPIPECLDREQRLLGPTGVERQRMGPSLTAQERAEAAEQERQRLQERQRQLEQQRMDRALLQRYANKEAHDVERSAHMAQLDERQDLARARLQELEQLRLQIYKELAPYQARNEKPPARLSKSLEENEEAISAQKRTIESNEVTRNRALLRFDDELRRLQKLWREQADAAKALMLDR